jgi:hypothetical protein
MVFLRHACAAIVLISLTLLLQSAGLVALFQWARDHLPRSIYQLGLVRSVMLLVRITSVLVCLHVLEILLWAWFYRWNCFPTWESAFYFSAVSYSTVGFGDLFLQPPWRTFGPLESITGVLMCGVSASFMFAVMFRLVERERLDGSEDTEVRGDHVVLSQIVRKGDNRP